MKVVLSGYYGFHNVGDEAILFAIIEALKKEEPAVEIVVFSNDPEYTKKTYGVDAVNRWKLAEVSKVIRSSDGFISGGGSLLQDKTGGRSVVYYTGLMLLAKWWKKPVFIYAQGMGPLEKKTSRSIVSWVLSKVEAITVRDTESKELLKEIGVKKKIELVPDPVIGVETEAFTCEWLRQQHYTNPVLAVSVRDWPSEYPFLEEIAKALDYFAEKGNQIVFIPMHGKHDEDTSLHVLGLMKGTAEIAPHDLAIEEKIALIGNSKLLVAMRLHALIFAAITETPFVAISYDPKIDSFAKLSNQPVAGHVNEAWSSDVLIETIEQHLADYNQQKAIIRAFYEQEKAKAASTAQKAIQCFR